MQKTQALLIYTTIASFLVVSATYALITTQKTIRGTGMLKSTGIGVYWDPQCTSAASSLDYGLLEPGSQKDFTLYLRNEGNSVLTLSMDSENWDPVGATDYLALTWSREGQQVNPDEVMELVITLSMSENVQGISSFSFDILIVGTG